MRVNAKGGTKNLQLSNVDVHLICLRLEENYRSTPEELLGRRAHSLPRGEVASMSGRVYRPFSRRDETCNIKKLMGY